MEYHFEQHMPIIAVSLYPGRTKEQKAAFVDAITEADYTDTEDQTGAHHYYLR